jgi:hypothetical protein
MGRQLVYAQQFGDLGYPPAAGWEQDGMAATHHSSTTRLVLYNSVSATRSWAVNSRTYRKGTMRSVSTVSLGLFAKSGYHRLSLQPFDGLH